MSESAHSTAAAWYPDPSEPGQLRWWDGTTWTVHVAPASPIAQAQPSAQRAITRDPIPPADSPRYTVDVPTDVTPEVTDVMRSLVAENGSQARQGVAAFVVVLVVAIPFGFAGRWVMLAAILTFLGLWYAARMRVWSTMLEQRGFTILGAPDQWQQACTILPVLQAGFATCSTTGHGTVRGFAVDCGEFRLRSGAEGKPRSSTFQFAAFTIPDGAARRHPAVSVRERRVGAFHGGGFDGEPVEFESISMHQQLTVKIGEGADPIATRELFGPQLIAALAETPVSWDQRGACLLVFRTNSGVGVEQFDSFMDAAACVARAYWSDQA